MAWLEAHQELRDHPKTKRAARMLGITRPQMIGHMMCLWWWCLDYAQDGNLTDFDNADIADAAEWEGEPDDFVNALLECGPADRAGFLVNDNGLYVKDWQEYGGKYIVKRNQSRDRQRAYRERNAPETPRNDSETPRNADVTRYGSVSNSAREDKIREDKIREETATAGHFAAAVAAWEAGGLTVNPIMSDEIEATVKEWEKFGHPEYVKEAIEVAIKANVRRWDYVQGILRRCADNGTAPNHKPGKKEATNGKSSLGFSGVAADAPRKPTAAEIAEFERELAAIEANAARPAHLS